MRHSLESMVGNQRLGEGRRDGPVRRIGRQIHLAVDGDAGVSRS